jgi:hypothetical protein
MRFTKMDDKVIAELESIKSDSIFVSDEIDSKISDILTPVIDGSTLEDLTFAETLKDESIKNDFDYYNGNSDTVTEVKASNVKAGKWYDGLKYAKV